jgi:hypothetical protein
MQTGKQQKQTAAETGGRIDRFVRSGMRASPTESSYKKAYRGALFLTQKCEKGDFFRQGDLRRVRVRESNERG